jgi:hypothetical protein
MTVVPAASLSDLPHRARALERSLLERNVRETAGAAVLAVGAVLVAALLPGTLLRAGCAVLVLAALAIVRILWATGWRVGPDPAAATSAARQLIALRSALAQQRQLLRSSAAWYLAPLVAGGLLVWSGLAWQISTRHPGAGADLTLLAGPALMMAMVLLVRARNHTEARRLGLAIGELDDLARQLPAE